MWDFGAARKQTVTAEYLGQRLADEIWRDVHKPRDPLPRTYIVWEWLIIRTFVATRVVQALLGKDAADRALYAMRARICHPTHFTSRHALTAFEAVADLRQQEYSNAFNIWRTQKDEEPLTRALATHVLSETADVKEVLDLFIRFVACQRTLNEMLRHYVSYKCNVR
jgi:hypothetical protein